MEFAHIKMLTGRKAEILIYEEIGNEMTTGKNVANEIDFLIKYGDVSEILVKINSKGGDIIEGFGIFSALQVAVEKGIKVTTQNDGLAASMALPIMLAAPVRKMKDFGLIMLHNPWGNKEEGVMSKFKEAILKMFTGTTNLSKKKLDKMMSEETWLNAQEALKLGFITEIIETGLNVNNKLESRNTSQLIEVYNKINNPENTIKSEDNMEEIAVRLGLPKTATKAEIEEAIIKMQATTTPTTPQIETERNIEVLMSLGRANGHIDDKNIDTFRKLAKSDYENVFNLVGVPKPVPNKESGEDSKTTPHQETITVKNLIDTLKINGNVNTPTAETDAQLFNRLTRNNPEELKEIQANDPKKFERIQKAYVDWLNSK